MGTYRYILRDTCRLIFRHWGISLLTFLTAAAVFFLVGGSSLLALKIRDIAEEIQSDLVIQAFSPDTASAEKVINALRDNTDVAELKSVSPQDGLERLKAKMGAQSSALTLLGENPLPWTIEIKVRRAPSVPQIVRILSSMKEVEDVVYSGALAERLAKISFLITRGALIILAVSVLVSALVFYNTIRISVYSRRQEISVMLLVGATSSYVESPFVLYGMILGVSGALAAVGFLHYGYLHVKESLSVILPFLNAELGAETLIYLYEIILVAGMALGWLCSHCATRRYIRESARPL